MLPLGSCRHEPMHRDPAWIKCTDRNLCPWYFVLCNFISHPGLRQCRLLQATPIRVYIGENEKSAA